jgi:hypothetical protein
VFLQSAEIFLRLIEQLIQGDASGLLAGHLQQTKFCDRRRIPMQKLTSWFRNFRWNQVLVVLLAGFFLLVNTACSNGSPSSVASKSDSYSSGRLARPVEQKKGGMNGYKDVDPRMDTSEVDAKAQTLVNRAKARLQDDRTPKEVIKDTLDEKPLSERARELSGQVSDSAKNSAEEVVQATQQGVRNLKQSTQGAVDDTSDFVEGKVKTMSKTAQKNLNNAVDKVQGKA